MIYYSKAEAISREDFVKLLQLIGRIQNATFAFDLEEYQNWTDMEPGFVTLKFKDEEISGSCSLLTNYKANKFRYRRYRFEKATLLTVRSKDIIVHNGYSCCERDNKDEYIALFYDEKK